MSDDRNLEVERSTSTAHRLYHYDGVCGNVHGHNMKWEVNLGITMEGTDESNMPVDFKDVSDLIDETDHAILLNADDPLLDNPEALGEEVIVFEGDPTCELMTQWMAERFVFELDAVKSARVRVAETDKYTMGAMFHESQEPVYHE